MSVFTTIIIIIVTIDGTRESFSENVVLELRFGE